MAGSSKKLGSDATSASGGWVYPAGQRGTNTAVTLTPFVITPVKANDDVYSNYTDEEHLVMVKGTWLDYEAVMT